MMIKNRITITRILIITLVVVSSLIMMAFGLVDYYREYDNRIDNLNSKLHSIATQMSVALVNPMWTFNEIDISSILESFMKDKEVYCVFVEDEKRLTGRIKLDNESVVPLKNRGFSKGDFFVEHDIFFKGEKIGKVGVCLTDTLMRKELRISLAYLLLSFFALNFSLVSILFFVLMKTVFSPLKIIEDYAIRMSGYSGIEDTRIQGKGFARELDNLKTSIEHMIHQLKCRYLELKKSQRALVITEKKYREIFDNAAEGIFQISRAGHLITANQALAAIMGYESSKDILQSVSNVVSDLYVDSSKRTELVNILNTKYRVSNFETEVFRKDKSIISISITAHSVFDDHDNIVYYEGMVQDITQHKIAEELKIAKEAAEATTQAKSVFLASMSHEIRTPISAIIGLTDLASKTELTDKQQDYLKKIDSSANDLLGIINDILDFSKIEAGELHMDNVAFPLKYILDSISDIFGQRIADKGLELKYLIDEDVPHILIGDPLRLRQILMNLTGNAIKFTEKGVIVISVEVEQMATEKIMLKVSVKDTGIGIKQEMLTTIFSPFTQVEPFITRQYGGTGLGLSICKQLVKIMDGEIWVESKEGSGTCFIFTAGFGLHHGEQEQTYIRSGMVYSQTVARSTIKGARILLVEDNSINRQVAMETLERLGFIVENAINGLEAVSMFASITDDEKSKYDAVLMDVQMPVMNGFEATRRIRKMEAQYFGDEESGKASGTPIIAMTAHAMMGDREKCIESGMDDYITKPIDSDRLFATLKKWIFKEDNRVCEKGDESENVGKVLSENQGDTLDYQVFDFFGVKELHGINLSRGIKRLGGNQKFYLKLLKEFALSHANDIHKIVDALEAGDIQLAKIYAHTLKGVTKSIAADQLSLIVEEIDDKLKDGADIQASLLENAANMISTVTDSIIKIKNVQEIGHGELNKKTSILSIDDITPILAEMYELLKNNRIDADQYSEIVKSFLIHSGFENLAAEMDICIGQFDFIGARAIVENIANQFEISL